MISIFIWQKIVIRGIKTLRNNLIVILIHLIINTIVFITYGVPSSFPKHGIFGEILIFLIISLLYFTFGYLLTGNALRYQNSKTKNITSISSIFILGFWYGYINLLQMLGGYLIFLFIITTPYHYIQYLYTFIMITHFRLWI